MKLDIAVELVYRFDVPTDVLLQIEAAGAAGQTVVNDKFMTTPVERFTRVPADDAVGNRIWFCAEGEWRCNYSATVELAPPAQDMNALKHVAHQRLPAEAIRYLMPSRFCPSDLFGTFVTDEFGQLEGGARIGAMRDWIESSFSYVPGASGAQTSALDSFVQRQGVCRDYAHVMISLARASDIPARFASVYAPDVQPQDFHAVAEVYLEGAWHLVDATGMSPAGTMARIGVGADAAHVAFLTAFGSAEMVNQAVNVQRLKA